MPAHKRWLAAALLAAAGGTLAQPSPCILLFGQGRNVGEPAETAAWDALNQRLHARVQTQLDAAGRRVRGWVASTDAIDPPHQIEQLLRLAREHACFTVVETAVFADAENDLLIARLRAYPILPTVGGQDDPHGLRIGAPFFSTQRDFAGAARALIRFNPEALGDLLADDYLRRP